MGLDFSHDGGFLWSYSSYRDFIRRLGKAAASHPLAGQPDPIHALLDHSDCEGFFEPWECELIADRMVDLVVNGQEFDARDRHLARQMAQRMKRASDAGERFLYF